MSPDEIKKLLGGYATGTLTPEEQQALFAAALEDQELFDALAREQSLRDLLRDPAARAELLGALDAPTNRPAGFWDWLRRPAVAALATAGVAAIAIVAVWQGMRVAPLKQAQPVIVADLKSQPASAFPPAEIPAPQPVKGAPVVKTVPPARMAAESAPPVKAPPLAGMPALIVSKDGSAAAPTSASPPPPAVPTGRPAVEELKSKAATESTVAVQSAGAISGAAAENVTIDARALFYANQPVPAANAFAQPGGGGGAAPPPVPPASRTDAAPRSAEALSVLAASGRATALRLGVRVSILRATGEVDLTTVLDPGETVRLKLIPNADGFLYVTAGGRTVASGAAQRLKPFETPELLFQGTGQKQFYVMLSRSPRTGATLALGDLARSDLMESSAGPERATYVVSGPRDAGAQQVVVPVTLTYR